MAHLPTSKTYSKLFSKNFFFQLERRVLSLGTGLCTFLKRNDHVGLCSKNRVEWIIGDLACIMKGLVIVPYHFTLEPETLHYMTIHSDVRCVIIESQFIDQVRHH